MNATSDTRTDRELVLGFRPDARVESRISPTSRTRPEYRVAYARVPGSRDPRPSGCTSEARAWQAACVRLGLRANRA